MRRYAAEFIGTFFLIATIGFTAVGVGPDAALAALWGPLAVAAMLTAMIYACGPVSGAHFNPAVTVAAVLCGPCRLRHVPGYLLAQVAGAVTAAAAVPAMKGSPVVQAKVVMPAPALLAEFLFTFALVWVILQVAAARSARGNPYYGLAIGLTVLAGAEAVGTISGAAFNPAVALACIQMGLLKGADLWIYLVANFGAALAAALLFRWMERGESGGAAAS